MLGYIHYPLPVEAAVYHRISALVLCDELGSVWAEGGREAQEGGMKCKVLMLIHTNTTL